MKCNFIEAVLNEKTLRLKRNSGCTGRINIVYIISVLPSRKKPLCNGFTDAERGLNQRLIVSHVAYGSVCGYGCYSVDSKVIDFSLFGLVSSSNGNSPHPQNGPLITVKQSWVSFEELAFINGFLLEMETKQMDVSSGLCYSALLL